MTDTKNLEKVKAIVESHMGKNYMADFTDIPSPNLGEKPCYCIHRKALISGYPIIGKIWKGEPYKIEIIKKSFGPTAKKIEEDLKKSGIEAKVVISKEIQDRKKLEKLRKVINDYIGKKYKVVFKDIRSWEEDTITYGVYRKTFWTWYTSDPLVAEIWTDDCRIIVKEESFKPKADELAKHFKEELGLESRVEWDFILKEKKAKQK